MALPKVQLSIVVPTWNPDSEKEAIVSACLDSLLRNTDVSCETIIVDNGSTYAVDTLRKHADIYVRNTENLGYAKAVNQGYKLAKGEYVAIVNDDIIVGPFWASRLISSSKDGAVSMPALLAEEQHKNSTDMEKTIQEVQDSRFWQFDYKDIQPFPPNDGFGALYLAPRSTWEEVAYPLETLLDEGYEYMMFEDRDLWRRCNALNIPVQRNHCVWVYHGGNKSWVKLDIDHQKVYERNEERFKNALAGKL